MRLRHTSQWNKARISQFNVLVEPTILSSPKLEIELGSGKGEFICNKALNNLDIHYVSFEKVEYIMSKIVQKRDELKITNLTLVCDDALLVNEYFKESSVDIVYLNFSDPWPKRRYHKFRLTYPTFLEKYKYILKPNGKLIFKTDHLDFFNDSVGYISNFFNIDFISRDFEEDEIKTEYEIKFSPIHKINKLVATIIK